MLALILGIAGFGLFLLYDINSYAWKNRLLQFGFLIGVILIAAATLMEGVAAWRAGAFSGTADMVLLLLSVLALACMIYCLFFALPFQDTYAKPENGRRVYTFGVYALCRHPGVPCFFLMYLFLGLAALPTQLLGHGMVFSLLNVGYAWFQDRVTFPKTFCDYESYYSKAPFMIPTKNSIRRAIQTWGCPYKKEEEL